MQKIELRKLGRGDLFRLAGNDDAPVWVRDEYDRSERKYLCYKWNDVNHWTYMRSVRAVYAV